MKIAVIILTYNEENHISRCINSVLNFSSEIIVVDSFSTDRTVNIAQSFGAKVYQHKFVNQAKQLNWFLENHHINSDWLFRIDADEIVTNFLAQTLKKQIAKLPRKVSGLKINRRIYFQGKWIKHGGIYPTPVVRIWRKGMAFSEDRWMDEHMVVKGDIAEINGDLSDVNLNGLSWWIDKHNNYASREAIETLLRKDNDLSNLKSFQLDSTARRKKWIKKHIYSKFPLGFRALVYFLIRYFLRLGFLDGSKGFTFHLLQGFWYRFLVDQKVKEFEEVMQEKGITLNQASIEIFGIKIQETTD